MIAASLRIGGGGALGRAIGRDVGWMLDAAGYLPAAERAAAEGMIAKLAGIGAATGMRKLVAKPSNDTKGEPQ